MKKGYSLIQVIIIIFVTAIISGVAVGVIFYNAQIKTGTNYNQLLSDENIQDFLNSYAEITNDYYEEIDKEKLIQSAVDAMVDYLDETYTSYLSEDEANNLSQSLNDKYEGIGIVVSGNKVISLLNDSPALDAGIMENDIITKVNDTEVSSTDTTQITSLIKEKENVLIEVNRSGQTLAFNINSKELDVPNVSYYILDNTKIGYLDIDIFSSNVANEVQNALTRLDNLGNDSLIIDLRGNSGGYLDQTYDTAQLFLKKGKVIYYLDTKGKREAYKDKTSDKYTKPIIILIDSNTASAAEILAAALKDSYGAQIVGVKSFGKGKVQHTYNFSNGSLIKYTSSRWIRPNGVCVDGNGIEPDYIIENNYNSVDNNDGTFNISIESDNQLSKAIELLSN